MLKDNNLVRVLAACETMGNVTTVCSDKTGTLTQNKMTVVAGTLGAFLDFDAIASGLDPKISPLVLSLVHDGIAINSTAFQGEERGEFIGNKTETALLTFAQTTGAAHYATLRTQYPTEQMYPFSSTRKAMATVIRMPHPTEPDQVIFRAHVKGASEIVMGYCSKIITAAGAAAPLLEDDRQYMSSLIQTYASKSLRTIGLAYRDFDQWPPNDVSFDSLLNDLVMLSVVGIEDPLRPGVTEAVRACQQAGVVVRMVTGDNLITAKSIARQCGIYRGNGIVMEGPDFRALSATEMDAILPRLQVLARSSPQDKQLLVGRLQAMDDVVAVTGDGTNDGPALKMANVGFSMGITGTEVAKVTSEPAPESQTHTDIFVFRKPRASFSWTITFPRLSRRSCGAGV
jgi:Ca2+-transporting ATPase